MTSAPAKRFWKTTSLKADGNGYTISLDGRLIKTPEGFPFLATTEELALAIRDEWDNQTEKILPETMPMYKFAVTAIDRVSPQRDAVIDELVSYGGNDLICYREDRDQRLAAHQHKVWQPYVDWAESSFGISLQVFSGIMPGDQPETTKKKLRGEVDRFDDFSLSGLHGLVTVSGSLILGLAASKDLSPLEEIVNAAFLDDLWQQDKWGYDEEAGRRLSNHRQQFKDAHRYLKLLG
jgi:chaperone required for assembly of F1-ATPase